MPNMPNPSSQGNDLEGLARESSEPNSMAMLNLLTRNSSLDRGYFMNMNESPAQYSRQQSHGNLFTGMAEEAVKVTQESQSYTMLCLEYEKYLFDNRIRMIIKRMSIKAYRIVCSEKDSEFLVFPIQKLLTTISKKLLLNRFELLFLEYVFSETKWNYKIDCIIKNAKHFNSFILLPDYESENPDIKYMQIYILYCAYYSKKSLNELPADSILNEFLHSVSSKYREHFQEWSAKSSMPSRINPKTLNTIYRKLTYDLGREHEETENYCLIVEQVLDISPAYNADKTSKQKKSKRKKKENPRNTLQPSIEIREEAHQPFSEIVHQESDLEISIPAFKNKKKSSFVSNVDPFEPRHYITRNNSYHD